MGALVTSGLVFAFICAGILLGIVLPGHRLDGDTKDVVRLGTGLIGTMVSLVLGLLIGSAKESYDVRGGEVRQLTANLVLLDQILTQYGPDAHVARVELRQAVTPMVQRIWHEGAVKSEGTQTFHATNVAENAFVIIEGLAPKNDLERELKARAVPLTTEIVQTRLLLFESSGNPIPIPFLVVLASWLVILFASYGFFAKPNATIIVVLPIFGLATVAAIFLILELSDPFQGLLQVSSEPLQHALDAL